MTYFFVCISNKTVSTPPRFDISDPQKSHERAAEFVQAEGGSRLPFPCAAWQEERI